MLNQPIKLKKDFYLLQYSKITSVIHKKLESLKLNSSLPYSLSFVYDIRLLKGAGWFTVGSRPLFILAGKR